MKTTHTLNMDAFKNAVKSIDKAEAKSIGQYTAAAMSKRIRLGKTFEGEQLDPNSDFWEDSKLRAGEIVEPLQQTGAMTQPTAWEVEAEKNGFILELSPEHREKWDNIHAIAEEKGKNWNQAWALGILEKEVMLVRYLVYLKKKGVVT